MLTVTTVRQNGVTIYIDAEDEHVCVGSGVTDREALTNAITDLEEVVAGLKTMLDDAN